MNRRDAISRVALIMGGTMVGMEYLLSGCKPKSTATNARILFHPDHIQFLDEVGDTILPATKTPGAKEVHIGSFMALMVNDCYVIDDQQIFIDGITNLNERCQHSYGKPFLACDPKQRTAFLTILDKEQRNYTKTKTKEQSDNYFKMMKELTLLG